MRSSVPLFDALADGYEEHFRVAHRRAYDDLAWERVTALLPAPPGPVVDAGCGVGRWAVRLLRLGYQVVGLEQAPAMAAEVRGRHLGEGFTLIEGPMEEADLGEGSVGMVLALGSLQYTADPMATLRRLASWLRPGGVACVLVDSLVALTIELLRAGRTDEAMERLRTRRGVWGQSGHTADLHLLDRTSLEGAMTAAGLQHVEVAGLLIGATVLGRDALAVALTADPCAQLARERALSAHPVLADAGKQLFASGRRP